MNAGGGCPQEWLYRAISKLREFYPAAFPLICLQDQARIDGIADDDLDLALDDLAREGAIVLSPHTILETLTGERLRRGWEYGNARCSDDCSLYGRCRVSVSA